MRLGMSSTLNSMAKRLPTPVTRGIGKVALIATKHSPLIFAIGGGILAIGAVIEAAKATPRFVEELDKYNGLLEEQKAFAQKVESGEIVLDKPYTKKEQRLDRIAIYAKVMATAVKSYGKSLILLGGSFACYGMALKILNGWFVGASASLAATQKELSHLEENVEKEYGAEVLQKLKGPNQSDMIIEGHVDENGKTVVDSSFPSVSYDANAILFDVTTSDQWSKDPMQNVNFLRNVQRWANWHLISHGHIFENDIREKLGVKKTQKGAIRGNMYYKDPAKALEKKAANQVVFSIFDKNRKLTPEEQAFLDGTERSVWITLNLDPEPIIFDALPAC